MRWSKGKYKSQLSSTNIHGHVPFDQGKRTRLMRYSKVRALVLKSRTRCQSCTSTDSNLKVSIREIKTRQTANVRFAFTFRQNKKYVYENGAK